MGILLKFAGSPVNLPSPVLAAPKYVNQAVRELLRDLVQSHLRARPRGTFHPEVVPVGGVLLEQGPDNQGVDRHPDGWGGWRLEVREPISLPWLALCFYAQNCAHHKVKQLCEDEPLHADTIARGSLAHETPGGATFISYIVLIPCRLGG